MRFMETAISSASSNAFRAADTIAASKSANTLSLSMFLSRLIASTIRTSSVFIVVPTILPANKKAWA